MLQKLKDSDVSTGGEIQGNVAFILVLCNESKCAQGAGSVLLKQKDRHSPMAASVLWQLQLEPWPVDSQPPSGLLRGGSSRSFSPSSQTVKKTWAWWWKLMPFPLPCCLIAMHSTGNEPKCAYFTCKLKRQSCNLCTRIRIQALNFVRAVLSPAQHILPLRQWVWV